MKAIQARIAAVIAAFIIAKLTALGVQDLSPEQGAQLENWLRQTFDVALLVGYAVVHPWLQRRWNPTGAFTKEAATRLEQVAHQSST